MKDALEFEAGGDVKRQIYDQMAIDALADMAEYFLGQDHYNQAYQAALRQIDIDPYREIAHRQCMRSLLASDRRAAAIKHFEQYQKLLESDLGVGPEGRNRFVI